MKPIIDYIVKGDEFHEEIVPNVWIMDNHKWAFWAWFNFFTQFTTETPIDLYHFDYHWDAVNDFNCIKSLSDISQNKRSEMYRLVIEDYIPKDGFIAPAIIKGFFNEIHFYCKQCDTQIGFSTNFLKTYSSNQYVYRCIEDLVATKPKKTYAFDLDIDLFNDSGMYLEADLWPKSKQDEFFSTCESLIRNASIITIAMSFGYSGTKEDTISLAEYVLNEILSIRKN